ncbi:MAG: hypothetical protein AAFQ07_03845 [Chloroflexota bacterium]
MSNSELSPQAQQLLRRLPIGIGVLIILGMVGLEFVGSTAPGFGTAQIVGTTVGAVLILIGVLGDTFGRVYRGIAVLLLNTVLVLVLVEVGAMLFLNRISITPANEAVQYNNPYYETQDWYPAYLEDLANGSSSYFPYLIWRQNPSNGTVINVDSNRNRVTVGADCTDDAYQVFVLGGSTVFGDGATDDLTIPSLLQSELNTNAPNQAICVTNFGVGAYVSTQDMILLLLQLESGNIPDAVIFYNGGNDTLNGYFYQQPVVHWSYLDVVNRMQGVDEAGNNPLANTSTFRLLQRLTQSEPPAVEINIGQSAEIPTNINLGADGDTLGAEIAQTYINMVNNVSALATVNDFDVYFFWQPLLAADEKPLSGYEVDLVDAMPDGYITVAQEAFTLIETEAQTNDALYYLGDVFASTDTALYYDPVHVTPIGNRIIVDSIWQSIGDALVADITAN